MIHRIEMPSRESIRGGRLHRVFCVVEGANKLSAPKAADLYGFVAAIPSREFRDGMGTRNANVIPNLLPRLNRRFHARMKCLATQWIGKLRRRIDHTPEERAGFPVSDKAHLSGGIESSVRLVRNVRLQH